MGGNEKKANKKKITSEKKEIHLELAPTILGTC